MAFRFPFSNLHELGLDWILEQVKHFAELIPEMETSADDIQHALDTATTAQQTADTAQDTAETAIEMISHISGATPSDTLPVMDGTATAGQLLTYSRGDHKHPTDTSRASQAFVDDLQADLVELSARVDDLSGGATPSSANPQMDGTATPGISANYSRGDHVHPTDTSRASKSEFDTLKQRVDDMSGGATPSSASPLMDGTASAGSSADYSRGDHRHPTDTSRAAASDLITVQGNVSTLSTNLSTLQSQVNNLDIPDPSDDNPLMDGNVSAGSSSDYSRKDHRHPTDTTRAAQNAVLLKDGTSVIMWDSGDDLDDLNTGIALCNQSVAHVPSAAWWLVVSAGGSGTRTQIAFALFNNEHPKIRNQASGTWSSWDNINSGTSGTVIQAITLQLPASWTSAGTNIYSQAVTMSNVTANTKVDLNPGAGPILQMVSDGTYAIYVENNNGTLTAYAVGAAPTALLTISGVRYEVS